MRVAAGFERAKDFAKALGISPEQLSRLENGRKDISRPVELAARYLCQPPDTADGLLRKLGKEMGWRP